MPAPPPRPLLLGTLEVGEVVAVIWEELAQRLELLDLLVQPGAAVGGGVRLGAVELLGHSGPRRLRPLELHLAGRKCAEDAVECADRKSTRLNSSH